MYLSIKNVVFACLSLSSAGASLSNGDILKMMEEQNTKMMEEQNIRFEELKTSLNGQIAELEKTIEQNYDNQGSSNTSRQLRNLKKNKGPKYKDRNICYSKVDDTISVNHGCYAFTDTATDKETKTGCRRRMLTHDEARANVQDFSARRKLCDDGSNLALNTVLSPMGFKEVGAIKIGKE
jgi:hypothetical protein